MRHFLLQGIFPTRDRTQVSYISCTAGRFFTITLWVDPTTSLISQVSKLKHRISNLSSGIVQGFFFFCLPLKRATGHLCTCQVQEVSFNHNSIFFYLIFCFFYFTLFKIIFLITWHLKIFLILHTYFVKLHSYFVKLLKACWKALSTNSVSLSSYLICQGDTGEDSLHVFGTY